MGDDSLSSGGELEAGELVIDDSYTHLSKKKKKSKKSKKKKDKEKDRDKDKSGKDKKHSKGVGGEFMVLLNNKYVVNSKPEKVSPRDRSTLVVTRTDVSLQICLIQRSKSKFVHITCKSSTEPRITTWSVCRIIFIN